jgi:hypothetical protein
MERRSSVDVMLGGAARDRPEAFLRALRQALGAPADEAVSR